MKFLSFFLLTIITLLSCNSDNAETVTTLDPNTIQTCPVVHDSLTAEQIAKITRIQSVFAEVYPMSLEETIENFKKDQHPDNEIMIWMDMADAYEKYLNGKNLTLDTKKEVFSLILLRSMMPDEQAIASATLKNLSAAEAKDVLSSYSLTPDPIDVVKR